MLKVKSFDYFQVNKQIFYYKSYPQKRLEVEVS